jgi:hypothetical protein
MAKCEPSSFSGIPASMSCEPYTYILPLKTWAAGSAVYIEVINGFERYQVVSAAVVSDFEVEELVSLELPLLLHDTVIRPVNAQQKMIFMQKTELFIFIDLFFVI